MARRRYGYAAQKFYEAMLALAGTGTIQRRIEYAALAFTSLRDDDVPLELLPRYRALYARVTSAPARGDEGTIAATARAMSDDEAAKIAEEIVGAFLEVAPDFYPPREA
jgi:hypothetical protein